MSFFSAVKSFFEKLAHSNTWEKSVSTTLDILAPLTEEVIALTAGEPAAAEVASVISEVQKDLGVVAGVVNGAEGGSAPASLIATAQQSLNAVKSNLGALLAAGHIKDTATLTKVTATVNTIVGEVDAILGAIPTATNG